MCLSLRSGWITEWAHRPNDTQGPTTLQSSHCCRFWATAAQSVQAVLVVPCGLLEDLCHHCHREGVHCWPSPTAIALVPDQPPPPGMAASSGSDSEEGPCKPKSAGSTTARGKGAAGAGGPRGSALPSAAGAGGTVDRYHCQHYWSGGEEGGCKQA